MANAPVPAGPLAAVEQLEHLLRGQTELTHRQAIAIVEALVRTS